MHKHTRRVIALVLSMMMLIGVIPSTVFAAIENWEQNNVVFEGTSFGTNGYYNVISKKDYTLVPGAATETEMVLNNSAGTRRQVLHIIECDPSNPDISVVPGYYNIDKDLSDINNWRAAGVTNVAKYYEDELGYNVVAAMNTDLDYSDNAPRVLVYNGQNLAGYATASAPKSVLYVWNNNGEISCEVKAYKKAELDAGVASGTLLHAVSVSFAMTVNNGELVTKTEERTSAAAARSMVGVKEDGTLVLVMNDGRGANNSIGFCSYELGESMLALGCKWAANCDGGGSSSIVTKRAGETEGVCRCVPCDGAERPTKSSVMVVSNVAPTGVLNNVDVTSDYDYFAPGTTYTFDAEAIDTHGYAMDMPADATWSLSNASFGTIQNGTFVSNGTLGDVDVQVESGGAIVGTKTIHIANPTTLSLSSNETVLPYSTPDKVRTTPIPVVTKIGEADVYSAGAFSVALNDPSAAAIDGLVITATSDTTKSGVVATLTYIPTGATLTYTVTYGKGSEILWDFEDGIDGWLGQQDAHDWQVAHGVTPFDEDDSVNNSLYSQGQMNAGSRSKTFVSTVENGGKVHNGNKALGVEYDFRGADFNSWVYMILFNVLNENGENPDCVLRDTANGKNATAIGMWLYLPVGFRDDKNAGSLALQMNLFYRTANGTTGQTGINMQYNGKNINTLTEADIPDGRWIYVKGALPNQPYVSLTDPLQSDYRAPSVFRMYIKPSVAQTLTYYYDDITLDYSNAVDDREEPVISNPCYAYTDTAITINNGDTIPYYVDFSANAADFAANNATGIDPTSAAVYLDGVKFNNAGYFNGQIIAEDYPISEGQHTVVFEISDNLGNIAQLKRTINCTSTNFQGLYLDGHNDSGSAPLAGSMYYIDLKAKNIENIDKVETTIDLQTANTWETEHLEVADGFTASYTVNQAEPEFVTFTIEKTGDVDLTGDQTLLSVPVRVWNWDESWPYGGDGSAVRYGKVGRYSAYGEPVLKVAADVVYGKVNYIESAETKTASFGGTYSVDTVVDGNKTSGIWHTHDADLTVLSKAASCTEEGYENRTYCETCASVVDWGTTIPKSGHDYHFNNGQFVCSECDAVLDTTGFNGTREIGGELYFFIAGNTVSGWQTEDADSYYFDPTTFAAVDDAQTIDGLDYIFTDKVLTKGAWKVTEEGRSYYWAGKPKHAEWAEIEGETYHFNAAGIAATGYQPIAQGHDYTLYHFTDTGALIGTIDQQDGIFFTPEDNKEVYYFKDGYLFVAGLVEYNYEYYYFPSSYRAMRNSGRYIDAQGAHGYVPAGYYDFDDDCHIIYDFKNGVQEDGTVYKNGIKLKAYQLYNDGSDWYLVAENNKIAKDQKRYLNEALVEGTDFKVGYYYFDADGKMIDLNGPDENDYFYIHNEKQKAYKLCEYDGAWYLVAEYNKIARDQKRYLNETVCEGTPFTPGYYYFDADGRYSVMNGPKEDGYFYVNDVKQTAYSLHLYEGSYYFVVEYNKYAVDARRYLTAANLEGTNYSPGYYYFDEEGKMVVKNGPWSDGYFYNYNVQVKAYKVVEFEGDYYFVAENNKYVTSVTRNIADTMVGDTGIVPGKYEFGADGKMVYRQGPNADGYFYRANQKVKAYELCEYNGDYYLVAENNKYVKSATRKIQAAWLKTAEVEDIAPGSYEFDADGKMILE